eukprot:349984-Chlamydomonas_euryale.AAC.10
MGKTAPTCRGYVSAHRNRPVDALPWIVAPRVTWHQFALRRVAPLQAGMELSRACVARWPPRALLRCAAGGGGDGRRAASSNSSSDNSAARHDEPLPPPRHPQQQQQLERTGPTSP